MKKKKLPLVFYIAIATVISAGLFYTGVISYRLTYAPAEKIVDEDLGGEINPNTPFKFNGNSIVPKDTDADLVIGGAASSSGEFIVDPGNNSIQLVNFTNCNLDTDGSGFLVCGTDASGGGGGSLEIQNSYTDLGSFSSISFDAGHFTATDTTGEATIKLDWGSGGPASLSEAETITGNWVNTTNPWADNEVADTLTINGGTVTWTDLTTYPTGCTNQFVTTIGDTLTCASVDISANTNLAVTATGLTLNGDTIELTTGYNIPLTASTSAWETFRDTPSDRITAGTNLSWAGNTLNATGGGTSFFLDIADSGGTYHQTSSITYDAGHFNTTYGSPISSGSYIRLDWDSAGGPASLSQNETITGNWVNTANPWDISTETNLTAGDHITLTNDDLSIDDDFLLIAGDTATGLIVFSAGASGTYSEFTVQASASAFLGSAFTGVGDCNDATEAIGWTTTGVFNCRSVQDLDTTLTALASYNTNGILTQTAADTFTGRTITGTTNQITVSNGDGVAGNPTISIPTLLVGTGASFSYGEFTVQASASLFVGSAFSGNPDCNDAGDKLLWSAGLFTCGTIADADIPDNITITGLSGTNTGDVTLAGTPDYITISGQVITRAKLDISDDTNATGGTGITISTNDFSFTSTEIEATTWGAGGNASNVWTFNLSAGDPTMTWTPSGATLSLGFEALGYASASKFFTVDLGSTALVNQQFGIDEGGFGQFVFRASSAEQVLTAEKKMTLSIASTSFNTFSTRELMYLYRGITVKRMTCEVSSATSVVINFEDGSNNNLDSLTCGTTRVFDDGSISNATLTKGESLILERGTVTGEADFLNITITYVETRE